MPTAMPSTTNYQRGDLVLACQSRAPCSRRCCPVSLLPAEMVHDCGANHPPDQRPQDCPDSSGPFEPTASQIVHLLFKHCNLFGEVLQGFDDSRIGTVEPR